MILSNVYSQINRDLEEAYENGDLIEWINRCSDDLTPIALVQSSASFTITSTTQIHTFPTDRHKDAYMRVTDTDGNITTYRPVNVTDDQSKGYVPWGSTFTLQNGPETGSITLYYYGKIAQMANTQLSEEMEIDSEYHDLYILFGRGQIQFTEEDMGRGDSDRVNSMELYYARKKEFEKHRLIKTATQITIEVA